jgi:hypothetical protein
LYPNTFKEEVMQRAVVILAVAVGGAALFGASTPSPVSSARAAEVMRLERHFDSVDVELRSRDVSALNATQRANRAQLVGWLRDYRNAGRFPVNDKFTQPTPFFRDKDGVLCAMAYLIDRSGRSDIVDKVAATRNNAYIRQLADDPALISWLDSWGLSVAEAGRIQPSYGGGGLIDDDDDVVDSDVALGAIGLGGASLAMTAVNIVKPSTASGLVGVLAGVSAIIFGAVNLDDDEYSGNDQVGAVTIGLGALSLGAGIYGYVEAQRDHHRWRDRDRYDRRRRGYSIKVVPDLAMQRSEPRVGVLVNGRF